jgi:hypothetical protein
MPNGPRSEAARESEDAHASLSTLDLYYESER